MMHLLLSDVYRALRDRAGLSQEQLAEDSGCARRTIQRVELGESAPSPAQATAIAAATGCSDLLLAELLCKAMTGRLGQRVAILPKSGYEPGTPLGEAAELLHQNQSTMPRDQWRSWMERLSRIRTLAAVLDQEMLAVSGELDKQLQRPTQGEARKGPTSRPEDAHM